MNAKQWDKEPWNAQYMACTLDDLKTWRTKAGRRKMRLYGCGCARRVMHLLPHDTLRKALEVAEKFADGEVDKAKLAAMEKRVRPMNADGYFPRIPVMAARAVGMVEAVCGESAYNAMFSMTALLPTPLAPGPKGGRMLADLLRCIFGNPSRSRRSRRSGEPKP